MKYFTVRGYMTRPDGALIDVTVEHILAADQFAAGLAVESWFNIQVVSTEEWKGEEK